jgi:hypothetical protein
MVLSAPVLVRPRRDAQNTSNSPAGRVDSSRAPTALDPTMKAPLQVLALTLSLAGAIAACMWAGSALERAPAGDGAALEPGRAALEPTSLRRPLASESAAQREPIEIAPEDPSSGASSSARDPRARNLAQRREQIEAEIRKRSVRIADEVGLGTGAELEIARVLIEELDKLAEIRAAYVEGQPSLEARTRMRALVDGVPKWREERFTQLFGARAAAAIESFRDAAALEAAGLSIENPRN